MDEIFYWVVGVVLDCWKARSSLPPNSIGGILFDWISRVFSASSSACSPTNVRRRQWRSGVAGLSCRWRRGGRDDWYAGRRRRGSTRARAPRASNKNQICATFPARGVAAPLAAADATINSPAVDGIEFSCSLSFFGRLETSWILIFRWCVAAADVSGAPARCVKTKKKKGLIFTRSFDVFYLFGSIDSSSVFHNFLFFFLFTFHWTCISWTWLDLAVQFFFQIKTFWIVLRSSARSYFH